MATSSLSHGVGILVGSAGGGVCREVVVGLVVGVGSPHTTDSSILNGG